jgi:hypothetical protein
LYVFSHRLEAKENRNKSTNQRQNEQKSAMASKNAITDFVE